MYLFVICLLLTFYCAIGSVMKPISVLQTIEISSQDKNYKCPYTRKSKLFEETPAILHDCRDFKKAQSLVTIDENNIQDGLCILYYNNFENLCYSTNNATTAVAQLEDATPTTFTEDTNLVCRTLISNTQIVNNAKPGIDTITQILKNNCNRICTLLNGIIKPICSLSAYIGSITASITVANKEKSALGLGKESVAGANEDVKSLKNDQTDRINSVPSQDLGVAEPNLKNSADNKDQNNPPPEPDVQAPTVASLQEVKDEDNHIQVKVTSTSKVDDAHAKQNNIVDIKNNLNNEQSIDTHNQAPPLYEQDANIVKPRKETTKANVPHNEAAAPDTAKEIGEPTINNNKLVDSNTNNHPPVKTSVPISQFNPVVSIDKPEEPPIQKVDKDTVIKVGGREGEGDILPEAKEDEDIELEEGMVPPGDETQDFGNEVVPKSTEVRHRSESIKSSERLKPLQTDEERYGFSANYQNQNIDDSDSYFFSYFMMFCVVFICAYVAYHNKQKILALVVEGRRGRRPSRSRRPNSANYHKLDSNLEEAVTSTCNKNAPQVIY